jgi:2-phospho-L-lactate guanylyltransferase
MPVLAVLPIKHLDEAKTRLTSALSPGQRRVLAEAMFSDVLTALRRCAAVAATLVVTSDHGAERIAAGHGADVIADSGTGHSQAAAQGIAWATERGYARVLLVPGDCPLLSPDELTALIAHPHPARSALIVADRHGTGTNALLLTPPDALAPAFGPGSRDRHRQLAVEAGSEPELVPVPGLALDIDTPEDLAALQATLDASRGGAAHTRGMLNQLARCRA